MTPEAVKRMLDGFRVMYRERMQPPAELSLSQWLEVWVEDLQDLDDETGLEAGRILRQTSPYPPSSANVYEIASKSLGWKRVVKDRWMLIRDAARARNYPRARRLLMGRYEDHGPVIHCGWPDDLPLPEMAGFEKPDPPSTEPDEPSQEDRLLEVVKLNDLTSLVKWQQNGKEGWSVQRRGSALRGDFATPHAARDWVVAKLRETKQPQEADELAALSL